MCGIAGVALKEKNGVGKKLVEMLKQLQHRGTDSAGFAIYGGLSLGENEYAITVEALKNRNMIYGAIDSEIKSQEELSNEILRYTIFSSSHEHVMRIAEKLNKIDGIKVLGAGKYEMIKDIGTVDEVEKRFRINEKRGTHGLGHVRFSTESNVDRYHAHPFQSYLYPDTTVVHNGQITNVLKLRRKLEGKGHRFNTDNDTEVIVHYIADKLLEGYKLEEALKESVREMDGPFTYIIATPDEVGIVKDKLALRPATVYESKNVFAAASEKVALETITPSEEIGVLIAGEVRTFKVR
ncbi:MAG: glutamine amidotransferase [Candidatus Altiarchaeota archaeon]